MIGRGDVRRHRLERPSLTHQANVRIIETVTRQLGSPDNVIVAKDVIDSGNISAASVPLDPGQARRARRPPSSPRVLLFAFGGGLSWRARPSPARQRAHGTPPAVPAFSAPGGLCSLG
ncbi:3-oxoacyl-[acyl-carrier-protein] synthase III C-terminal domain-containing protein [Streptomyces buecherae]|uniref:3-oxoacyl-[acyl-carrier-protein] synthase III C-terminal domain-containing protein n=1 Tax=Streptomyces buecherae TaxID=2763006 RepID=UPI003655484B